MKRIGGLTEKVADMDNLRLAFWKASKGKRYSKEVLHYGSALGINLLTLRGQIVSGEVAVGKYRYFKIYEPKERKICASAFSEQVLHHALMNVCHEHFERYQIHESYASRKGKGTHAALEQAYIRYMDDMVLWHDDKRILISAGHEIDRFIRQNLCCDLKPILLNQSIRGLPFLGYSLFPYQIKLTQQSKRRFCQKLLNIDKYFHLGEWSASTCQRHVLPLLAFANYADTQKLKESLFRTIEKANHRKASIV
jgi:hypothetical protein